MKVKLDGVINRVIYETVTKLHYVDYDGNVYARYSEAELIKCLKKHFKSVVIINK